MTRKSAIKIIFIFLIISALVFVVVYYFNNKQITFESALNDVQKGDFESALSKFYVLAMEDNVHAQINLGMLYENGRGVAVNNQKAYVWYQLANTRSTGITRSLTEKKIMLILSKMEKSEALIADLELQKCIESYLKDC